MPPPPARPSVALATSDLGNSACGVGNTVGTLLDRLDGFSPVHIDTAAPWAAFARSAREAARSAELVVVVYPTLSTARRPWALLRMAALRWWFRRGGVRLYLHEFGRLGRKHRAGILAGLFLSSDRIVVCVPSEARAVGAAARGLAVRGQDVVAVPTVNGTAPGAGAVEEAFEVGAAHAEDRERTAGVFGTYRPDKGPDWLDGLLRRLDGRFDRLELVGSGWEDCELSAPVRRRYEVVHRGHVPTDALASTLGRWGLAVAPFWEGGTHDGRGSLRTPLAYGVTTLTRAPRPGDLSLEVPHLLFDDAAAVGAIPVLDAATRRAGARAVAEHEADAVRRAATALFDVEVP